MEITSNPVEWILGIILILSSLGVILARKPVHSNLSFLLTLMTLAVLYLHLSAQFIAVMQVLVYAGAILVLFMFVMILFQDAYIQIDEVKGQSFPLFLIFSGGLFILSLIYLGTRFIGLPTSTQKLPENYGTVQALGEALYINFFFPFEAVILLFLIALIGALYTAMKVK
jgi:NADH-quinone oxidoreductase subunit J